MAKVENVEKVIAALRKHNAKVLGELNRSRAKGTEGGSVVVGFTAAYALYVHENMEARHHVGQAKFLEQPARELSRTLGEIVAQAVKAGRTVLQGLLLAGLRLQREAQQRCPVDTGNLKASAFTLVED